MGSYGKRWVFTLNNYTQEEEDHLVNLDNESFSYLVFGRERGESGTPHLQGFIVFNTRKRITQLKQLLGDRYHFESARGTSKQAADYCKKDGDFVERGDTDVGGQSGSGAGRRNDWDDFKEWLKAADSRPSDRDVAEEWPTLFGRYPTACRSFRDIFAPRPCLVSGDLRPWQQELDECISQDPDDRAINFIIDAEGNKGKSWLVRYWYSHRSDIQRLSVGKRDDLAFAIDVSKRVFVFDIPRGNAEFLQYGILEQLKDQMVFSPKYESICKIIPHKVHVIVFMNENPDIEKMTFDRFKLTIL